MNNKKIVILLVVIGICILGVGGLMMFRNNNQTNGIPAERVSPAKEDVSPVTSTEKKKKTSPFSINIPAAITVSKGSQLEIPIDVKGASTSLGISGLAVKVRGIPNGAKNPTMLIDGKSWAVTKNESTNGEVIFVSNNPSAPLSNDKKAFMTIRFSMDDPQTADLSVEVELDDTATPSMPHKMDPKTIHLSQ